MVLMINSSKLLTHIPFFCNNSKPTLWALLHSLPTSFYIKEAFFGDKLRGEGANVWHWNIYAILRCNAIFLCSREMLDIHKYHLFIFFKSMWSILSNRIWSKYNELSYFNAGITLDIICPASFVKNYFPSGHSFKINDIPTFLI